MIDKIVPLSLEVKGDETNREYQLVFRAVCTENPLIDTPFGVRNALAVLGFYEGAPLSIDLNAICKSVKVAVGMQDRRSAKWWHQCTAIFATKTKTDPEAMKKPDPKDRPWKISLRPENYTAPAIKDSSDAAVTNSSGDTIRRDKQRSKLLITVDMTAARIDPALFQEYPDGLIWTRNAAIWYPWGPYSDLFSSFQVGIGKGLLRAMTADTAFEHGEVNIPVHAEVLVDGDYHRDRFWDEGYRGWQTQADKDAGRVRGLLVDPRTRSYPSSPLPLNGAGVLLTSGTLHELNKQYYPNANWTPLPFWATV